MDPHGARLRAGTHVSRPHAPFLTAVLSNTYGFYFRHLCSKPKVSASRLLLRSRSRAEHKPSPRNVSRGCAPKAGTRGQLHTQESWGNRAGFGTPLTFDFQVYRFNPLYFLGLLTQPRRRVLDTPIHSQTCAKTL